MRIGFIGDIVGKPGRKIVKRYLKEIKEELKLDLVIANYENASHGFGLTLKNAKELFESGIDLMTGGNHTWDKKEIFPLLEEMPLLRPLNYPEGVPGKGVWIFEELDLAVLNVMGHYSMPMVENPFIRAQRAVDDLKEQGVCNIVIDFHAEATSEKRAMFIMLKNKITAMVGTHTHVGTDDLIIEDGCGYVTDIGLSGCRDNVIGMDSKVPIKRFLTGLPGRFEVPDRCRTILQMVVFELDGGKCEEAFKIKAYDDEGWSVSMRARKD